MIVGGNATVMVSNMDRAVDFYTGVLGLKLANRYGDHWAEVGAGPGLTIGLHPEGHGPKAGAEGSISIGFTVKGPIAKLVATLVEQGVRFDGPVVDDPKAGIKLAHFRDPDGNRLYLCESSWG